MNTQHEETRSAHGVPVAEITRNLMPSIVASPRLLDKLRTLPGSLAQMGGTNPRAPVKLTAQEHRVLVLIADGRATPGIARSLHISPHTVKFHVNALLKKFDAYTRAQVCVLAMRQGILK